MSFQQIPGQSQVKRILQNGLRSNSLAHAYIFSGPVGTNRALMASTLAKALYCMEAVADACGHCLECRKVENRNHPDVSWVEPDGATIKIDQIRELQKRFTYRSSHNRKKIYVIHEADKMTMQAANSLLKFLEEPDSDVVAILITENGHALLPTIRSRAQWITFAPMNSGELIHELSKEGLSPILVRPAAHLTSGLVAARELIQSNWFAETRNVMIQLARETITGLPTALLTIQTKVIKGEIAENISTLLDLWVLWIKDFIHIQARREDHLVYIDQSEWLSGQAFTREMDAWIYCMDRVLETKKRLRFNANLQLSLEQLAIDIKRGESNHVFGRRGTF